MPHLVLVTTEVICVQDDGNSYDWLFVRNASKWITGEVVIKLLYVT